MDSRDVIKASLLSARNITRMLLADLSDADLLVRPVPGANHIAWQLGHLIAAEHHFIEAIRPGSMPELPADFAAKHGKEQASSDKAADFASKAEYLRVWELVREGTLRAVGGFSDDELGAPGPEAMRSYAPTIASVFILTAHHELMHAGQYTVLRRKLGKPHVV